MDVAKAIDERRAYRVLGPIDRDPDGLMRDLARAAGLSPSCFNKQPWRLCS